MKESKCKLIRVCLYELHDYTILSLCSSFQHCFDASIYLQVVFEVYANDCMLVLSLKGEVFVFIYVVVTGCPRLQSVAHGHA